MKTSTQSKVLLILMLFAGLQAHAHDFEVGGVYYGISIFNKNTAYVTHRGTGYNDYKEYSGSVVIPESVSYNGKTYKVASIGGYAFYGCDGLTSVTIPASVTAINQNAFYGCDGLTSVTFPNSVTSIGNSAFSGCKGLTSITIPNSVTSIGGSAFSYCTGLASVTIGNSVTSIGEAAFAYCTGLTSVTSLNPTPPTCETYVFGNVNTQNISLSVPSESVTAYKSADTWKDFGTITGIGEGQEINIGDVIEYEGLTYKVISDTEVEVIAGESKYTGNVEIPSQITIEDKNYTVTQIGEKAFSGCFDLISITIPNSVTSIGDESFYYCSGLTSVTIPNSVTSIGSYAFGGCDGLTSVIIRNSVISIRSFAFGGCTGLTSVIIPNSVTSIGNSAFMHCTSLTSITIPNSVTNIGSNAFDNTGWYNNQPDGILYLDKCCLGYKGEKPTGTLTLKDDTRLIAGSAFGLCTDLASVEIPNSVTNIGTNPFFWCDALTSIVVESGNTVYDSRDNSNAIIETSTNALITGCKTTVIPNSITSIEREAFYCCNGLTSVTIPNSVTSIGFWAFYGCDGLTSVTSLNPTPPTCGTNVFGNVNTQNIPLSVPSESVSAYKSADTWKDFGTITGDANVTYGVAMSGVEEVLTDEDDAPAEYYTLQGVRVQNPGKGIYIMRKGNKITKIVRN